MPADCPIGMKLAAGANAAVEQILTPNRFKNFWKD
jgi:hypothetical protein